jgi:hypothetical protein
VDRDPKLWQKQKMACIPQEKTAGANELYRARLLVRSGGRGEGGILGRRITSKKNESTEIWDEIP